MRAILVLFIFSVFFAACVHEPQDDLLGNGNTDDNNGGGNGGGGGETDCDPNTVYFTNTILPLLQSRCAQPGCHAQADMQDGV